MLTGMELMACRDLAVPAEVMRHVVSVESGSNRYAIGVVGGQLVRQPKQLDEALATVRMLDAKGFNYSLGVAQINRANLGKYGLDTYEKAFQVCPNLAAGANILAACFARSGSDWGKAFSCYYSGNFVTGYRDGYVQKMYESINRRTSASDSNPAQAIPLQADVRSGRNMSMKTPAANNSAYRVALRSTTLDPAVASVGPQPAARRGETTADVPVTSDQPAGVKPIVPVTTSNSVPGPAAVATESASSKAVADIFVPQVRGANDPQPVSTQVSATAKSSAPAVDDADLRMEGTDGAFVF